MFMKVIGPGHKIDVLDKLKTEMSNAMTQTHRVNTATKTSKENQWKRCANLFQLVLDTIKITRQERCVVRV